MTTTIDKLRVARGVTDGCPAWCDGHGEDENGIDWHTADNRQRHLHVRGSNGFGQTVDPDYQGVSVILMQKDGTDRPVIDLQTRDDESGQQVFIWLTPGQALRVAGMLAEAASAAL